MNESVTWRDVRDAVAESERHILEAIKEIKDDYDDHETRLRIVEAKVDFFRDREIGVRLVLIVIVTAISVMATALAIAKYVGAI